jgi:hypothetical protein
MEYYRPPTTTLNDDGTATAPEPFIKTHAKQLYAGAGLVVLLLILVTTFMGGSGSSSANADTTSTTLDARTANLNQVTDMCRTMADKPNGYSNGWTMAQAIHAGFGDRDSIAALFAQDFFAAHGPVYGLTLSNVTDACKLAL